MGVMQRRVSLFDRRAGSSRNGHGSCRYGGAWELTAALRALADALQWLFYRAEKGIRECPAGLFWGYSGGLEVL